MAKNFNDTGISAYSRPRMRIGLYGCMIAPNFNHNEITNYFTCNLEKNNCIEFRHDNKSRKIFRVNSKNGEGGMIELDRQTELTSPKKGNSFGPAPMIIAMGPFYFRLSIGNLLIYCVFTVYKAPVHYSIATPKFLCCGLCSNLALIRRYSLSFERLHHLRENISQKTIHTVTIQKFKYTFIFHLTIIPSVI